tara:strand:- start:37303 stop:37884 length:582 start_codon:yes stop_codon:yes gene_type:complete
MFPLEKRKIIRGAAAHVAAGLGVGGDWVASTGTPLYAPFDGVLETYFGNQGGNWARLTRSNGDRIEMAHLDKYYLKGGNVLAGNLIAYTGNTGAITTGPHLHIQIIRDGKRIDPNAYNWEDAIIPPMNCETQNKEIIKLNTEIGKVTKERDDEREGHKQTFSQLETARAEITRIEAKGKANQLIIDNVRRQVA